MRRHYRPNQRPLRACHPRDLIDQVTALCRYRGTEPTINRETLDAACDAYFVDDRPSVGTRDRRSSESTESERPSSAARRRRQVEVR
jgi:hypothetical protein